MNKQQFKVKDWIRDLANNEVIQVTQHMIDYNLIHEQECELWKPKKGEWCWFWNDTGNVVVAEYKGEHIHGAFCLPIGQDILSIFKYCEPFIGELPSTIKEQACMNT